MIIDTDRGDLGVDDARDAGMATVWTASAIGAVFAVVVMAMMVTSVTVTRHRADTAADLAALAAAAHAVAGPVAACAKARWVTRRMRVALGSCRLEDLDALVEVTAHPRGVLAAFGSAHVHARAGPVAEGAG